MKSKTYTSIVIIPFLGVLYACEQKPREEWPIIVRDNCTDTSAKRLEAMKVRCQPAIELEPAAHAQWRVSWCEDKFYRLGLSKELTNWAITNCKEFYDRQMQNFQALKKGKPMPFPPPTEEELRKRFHESCVKYIEKRRKRGDDVEKLGSCDEPFSKK